MTVEQERELAGIITGCKCGNCPTGAERKEAYDYIKSLPPNPESKLYQLFHPTESMDMKIVNSGVSLSEPTEPPSPPEAVMLPKPTTPELQYLAAITERLGVIIEQNNVLITAFSAGVEPEPEADGRKTVKMMDGSVAQIG